MTCPLRVLFATLVLVGTVLLGACVTTAAGPGVDVSAVCQVL